MAALICGSLAYDSIMVFQERFRDHILPDQVHILNVSFLVPEMRREFGGCAGNISYNLKMLGGDPLPMAAVGDDFAPYRQHLDQLGISRQYVRAVEGTFTAQAFITTDIDDNQITAFHPGAMMESKLNQVKETQGVRVGIVAPDSKEAMMQHSEQFAEAGIPHIFDPGQGLPLFDGNDLRACIERADWITVNDYEAKLLGERTGMDIADIVKHVKAYIITRGPDGSEIHTADGVTNIPPVPPARVVDPTGCGDAYRAGLLWGILNDTSLETAARMGSLLGSLKIEQQGPQNHRISQADFAQRYEQAFGEALAL
ncbi:MAG: carbohydrate kinase family protein [Xanthomonadales bacterium]|nr:carbohydrate kinase family protein [Xanthomonadales bacterium]